MPHSPHPFTVAFLATTVFSLLFVAPAHATFWVGNDDGEFDVGSPGYPLHVGVQETFYSPMTWSSSPPNNLITLQYNPDLATSVCCQWFAQWFQTAIWSNPSGCGGFSIQVYATSPPSANPVWRADQGFTCSSSSGFLAKNATWTIQEDMRSQTDRTIVDVYFSVSTTTTSSSFTLFDGSSPHWLWERSNICWCGTNGGSATFSSAYGLSTTYSDLNVNAINPPDLVSTGESSNMPYSNFYHLIDNQHLLQSFGWCNCGGIPGGGGSVAEGSLITMANGTKTPVQNIDIGDRVIVYNVPTGYQTVATVYRVATVTANSTLTIHTTAGGSPFRADANPHMKLWVLASSGPFEKPITTIQPGDQIYKYDIRSWVKVTDVTITNGGLHTMYDLLTTPNFTSNGLILEYIANGYPDCPPTGCKA